MFDFFNSKIIKREYQCTQDTTLIKIISSSDSIRVTSGDTDQVRITYYECPGKHEYDLKDNNGILSLVDKKIISLLWGIHYIFLDTTMDVTIPKDFAGTLDLHCTSGRIMLKDITAGSLKGNCTSGAIRGENVSIGNEAQLSCTSGSIKLDNFKAREITASDHSGIIRFENVTAEGSINAHNTSGGVHFEMLKAGGNIALKTTSGSIKGSIVGNESDYSIMSKTTSGMNNLNNSRSGSRTLDVNATSGSIKIVFVE